MVNYIKEFIISCLSQCFHQQREFREEQKKDFVKLLPKEMINEIFSYLNAEELARCFRVNKQWKVLAEAPWKALPPPIIAFGKKQWEKYFEDAGKELPLPKDIHKILKSPCPFFREKKSKILTCFCSFLKLLMGSLSI